MEKKVKLIFASDWASIRDFAPLMEQDPSSVYGDLVPRLSDGDYRIVNLECPLHKEPFIVKSGAAFSGEERHINALKCIPFDAVICANNHTFDCGKEGFERTRDLLAKNGIASVGAGLDLEEARKELCIEKNGLRIGIFTLSEGEDCNGAQKNRYGVRGWEVELLCEEIRRRRNEFDWILVSAHCGLEYQPYPSFYVWEAFQRLAEAGADLIVGHHPHVPQGKTFFGKTPAYFSLGNFVFYQKTDLYYRKIGCFLEITFSEKAGLQVEKVPYRITEEGLRLLKGEEAGAFEKLFAALSKPLASREEAQKAWNAVLAWNGVEGYCAELEKILAQFRSDAPKGAAMLRNRVTCIQHSTQWVDGLTRIAEGTIDDVDPEMLEMIRDFMTRKVDG